MDEKVKRAGEGAEVKEFVSKSAGTGMKKRTAQAKHQYAKKSRQLSFRELMEQKQLLAVAACAVVAAVVIVAGIWGCKAPVVAVCFLVLIETLLAACLHNLPVWLHGTVIVAEILLGVFFGRTVCMLLLACQYLAAIFALKIIRQEQD